MASEEKVSKNEVINIYNPLDFPFGPLSNNYQHELVIEDKRYPTVTNYILSSMLITPVYKIILHQAPIKPMSKKTNIEDKVRQLVANIESRQKYKMDAVELEKIRQFVLMEVSLQKMNIHQLYDYYLGQEHINAIRNGVEKAYNAKVADNKALADFLLSTENRPIVYTSGNSILGNGPDNNGLNLIGKILMQIRHNLRMINIEKSKKEELDTRDEAIFTAYKAMTVLKKELGKEKDLSEYIGKNSEQIVKQYFEEYPDENLDSIGIGGENVKESVLEMFKRGQLPVIEKELKTPGYMVLAARRDNLRELLYHLENKKHEIIIKKYTQYTIKKKFPKMSEKNIEQAADQLLKSSPSREEYFELREKITRSYMKGKFDDELNAEIEEELQTLPNITEEDVEKAEKMIRRHYVEEEEEQLDSSSSSDEENPIKQLLGDSDEKAKKNLLIGQLQKFTGKSYRKYKGWDIEKLERELEKYTDVEPTKQPKEGTGNWVVVVKHTNNRLEILKKSTGARPSKREIEKIVYNYNKKHKTKQIKLNQVSVKWESVVEIDQPKTVKFRSDTEEIIPSFVKYVGEPVEIKPLVENNPPELQEFSPLFKKLFTVNDLTYPSVSIYITTVLITQTGISRDILDKKIFTRGTSIVKAREMLISNPNVDVIESFVSPDEANQIYNNVKVQSYRELLQTYARIGMNKKFEDVGVGQLLILTGNNKLVWNDPDDTLLGTGTKERPGENVGGIILTEIREKIKVDVDKYEIAKPLPTDTAMAISSDKFLNSWLQMRLNDMCSVVYKMRQYLSIVGKQEEDIDYKFVKFVLNLIYQPCSSLIISEEQNEIPMPEYFENMVIQCQGMPEKLSKDYRAEIQAIRDEMNQYDENFWGIVQKEPETKKKMSPQKFAKSLEVYKSQEPPPSEEQVASYEKSLLEEFEKQGEKEIGFHEKQRINWQNFIKEILKPALPWDEIYSQISKLRRKHEKELKKIKKDKKEETEKQQQKKLEELWNKLREPVLSKEERDAKISEFLEEQMKERREYYGITVLKKTKDDLVKREQVIKAFKERISLLNQQQKQEMNHIKLSIFSISKVYWDNLASMIYAVSKNIKATTQQDIRETIINAELLNSSTEIACQNMIENLPDPYDNCISSAICNLLVGIEAFKYQYQEDIPFGKHDIDLAVSIILGRNVDEIKPIEEEKEEAGGQLIQEEADEDFEQDMFIEEEDFVPYDAGDGDYGDVEEEEYIPYSEDENSQEENFSFARFGMKKPTEKKELVRMMLSEISKKSVSDSLVKYFIKSITTVKISKVPDRIKRNRINFFATLR